jgi:hypothetical protein
VSLVRRRPDARPTNLAGSQAGTTYGPKTPTEPIPDNFAGYVSSCFRGNGIVAAVEAVRLNVFAEARFQWQALNSGTPGKLFGTPELAILEQPWVGGTTGDLLTRMILDADFAGNAYVARIGNELVRLRPDWVDIVLAPRMAPYGPGKSDAQVGFTKVGYVYWEGGKRRQDVPAATFLPNEVAHFAPTPDPVASYRGMSWLTPVIREIQADQHTVTHKLKFFENNASVNLAVVAKENLSPEQFNEWVDSMDRAHMGVRNAYKCLHPDTDVSMWDGSRRRAEDVSAGDVVVAWSEGQAVPGTVAAAEWQPESPIVTVTTQRGRVIRTNDRHPFLARRVVRKHGKYISDESWIDAADLKPGDLLTVGLGGASDDQPDTLTAHEAWSLGVIVGDGSTVSSTPVVSAWDEGIRTRLETGYTLNHTGKGHDYRVLGIRSLCVQADVMGKRSYEKRIPESVMTGSAKVRAAFISGLIDTDGHVTDPAVRRSSEVGITSTSRELLFDAQHLLASLGINASVSLSMPASRGDRDRDAWRLFIFGNDQARTLASLLDLACTPKAERLAAFAERSSRGDRSRVDRVVSVEVTAPERTIGLEIAEHHTHVTGGVVTHNTLYLSAGADVTPVGSTMQQMDFANTQGAGEVRIANAAGIHPVVIGLVTSLGGSSLNAGNYGAAKRSTVDRTFRPLWRNVCGSLQAILNAPPGGQSRLWFSTAEIAFLRDDAKDLADIQAKEAQTIRTLVDGGWEPESAKAAVIAGDWAQLVHSGLTSVQLVPPADGTMPDAPPPAPAPSASTRWEIPSWLNGHDRALESS